VVGIEDYINVFVISMKCLRLDELMCLSELMYL
jgi:hypothetical protein